MFNMAKFYFPDTTPRGFWTKDGERIPGSEFHGPKGANDVLITICVQFTKDGKPFGDPILPPYGANDVSIDVRPPRH